MFIEGRCGYRIYFLNIELYWEKKEEEEEEEDGVGGGREGGGIK